MKRPPAIPAIRKTRPKVDANAIRKFYRRFPPRPRPPAPQNFGGAFTLTNTPTGIGDTVILLESVQAASSEGQTVHAWSPSPFWLPLLKFIQAPMPLSRPPLYVSLTEAVAAWDLGPGHMTQRARRLLGGEAPVLPRGWIAAPGVRRIRGRVSMHFEAGGHSAWQRANIHPRARQIYPDTWLALRKFIATRPDLTFVEVGQQRILGGDRVEDGTNRPLEETVRLMAECEYHLGVVSGPMHLAAALGSKVIAILNFPRPCQLMLPNLRSIGVVEEEWLYPHQVCLHQEEDSAHWPRLSARTLSEAIDGLVYPYWSDRVAFDLWEEKS